MICSAVSRMEANLHGTIFVSQYLQNEILIFIYWFHFGSFCYYKFKTRKVKYVPESTITGMNDL